MVKKRVFATKGFIVLLIAAVMVTACVLELFYVDKTFAQMETKVERLLVEIEKDTENVKRAETLEMAADMKAFWNKKKRLTEIMLNHILLIEYDSRINRLKSNVETNEANLSKIDGDQLLEMTRELRNLHTPHIHNIF